MTAATALFTGLMIVLLAGVAIGRYLNRSYGAARLRASDLPPRARGFLERLFRDLAEAHALGTARFRVFQTGSIVEGRATAGLPDIWIRDGAGRFLLVDRSTLLPLDDAACAIMQRSLERWPS